MRIKVPATTANMGPGFDCIGMALSMYNEVEVKVGTENNTPLVIIGAEGVPTGEDNLIYQTIVDFHKQAGVPVPPLTLIQQDNIPMTRGLGSSAACVAAGLLAGNALAKTELSRRELINMAAEIEGHPDNTTPALAGGLIIGAMDGNSLEYISIPPHSWEKLRFALMIPDFELSTEHARTVLPAHYSRQDVVHNASRTALLTAALFSGDYEKLAIALDDRIHQPYRLPLVPDMDKIFEYGREFGAYNVFLSGAGPTLIAITQNEGFLPKMSEFLHSLPNNWDIKWVEPDHEGAVLF